MTDLLRYVPTSRSRRADSTVQRPYYLTAEGQRVPRLTRILSILREPEIDARILDRAATRGTALHRMIAETLASGREAKLPRAATWEVRQAWKGWQLWRRLRQPFCSFIGVEHEAVSASYGYGATLDAVECHRITEWKVTSAIRAKHWIQLHAQVPLVFDDAERRKEVTVRVVRLDVRTGDYEEQEQLWNEEVWLTFMKLRDIYAAWYTHEWKE